MDCKFSARSRKKYLGLIIIPLLIFAFFFNGVQTAAGFALWAGGRVSLGALPDRDIIQRYGD